jgi:ribosomal protein S16
MLTIRLSRQWRTNKPFYRIVLTEHTKPVKTWSKQVLWRFDPVAHKSEYDLQSIKDRVAKWAGLSERLAKILFANTKDKLFQKFFEHRTRTAKTKKEEKK